MTPKNKGRLFGDRPDSRCLYPGCEVIVRGGYHYCMPHLEQLMREIRTKEAEPMIEPRKRGPKHGDPTRCVEPGCNEPRMRNTGKTALYRCEQHQHAYWNEQKAARRRMAGKAARPPVAPPVADIPPVAETLAQAVDQLLEAAFQPAESADHSGADGRVRRRISITNLNLSFDLEID